VGAFEDIAEDVRALDAKVDRVLALVERINQRLELQSATWRTRAAMAQARGCSIDTVDRMIERGELRSRKSGRRVTVLDEAPATDLEVARLAARAVSR
jgi:hypothetical protein